MQLCVGLRPLRSTIFRFSRFPAANCSSPILLPTAGGLALLQEFWPLFCFCCQPHPSVQRGVPTRNLGTPTATHRCACPWKVVKHSPLHIRPPGTGHFRVQAVGSCRCSLQHATDVRCSLPPSVTGRAHKTGGRNGQVESLAGERSTSSSAVSTVHCARLDHARTETHG